MKKLSKICILSIILIFLSISCISASEIDDDNIQFAADGNDIQEMSIDDVSLNEEVEGQSSLSNFNQMSDENEEDDLALGNGAVETQNEVLSASSSGNVHKVSPSNYSKYFQQTSSRQYGPGTMSLRVNQRPFVKSGIATGMPPFAMESSLKQVTAIQLTVSYTSIGV